MPPNTECEYCEKTITTRKSGERYTESRVYIIEAMGSHVSQQSRRRTFSFCSRYCLHRWLDEDKTLVKPNHID